MKLFQSVNKKDSNYDCRRQYVPIPFSQTLDVLLAINDAIMGAQISDIKVYFANENHDKINQGTTKGYCHVYGVHPNVCVIDDYITLVGKK